MTDKKLNTFLTLNSLFNVLLFTAGIFLGTSFYWGFNLLSFYNPIQLILLLVIGYIIFIPKFRDYLLNSVHETSARFNRKYLIVSLAVIYFALFYFFRIRVHFLGDGPMILRMLPEMNGVTDMIATNEPGSYALDLFVQKLLRGIFHQSYSPEYVYIFLSLVSGIAFIFISVWFIRKLNIDSVYGFLIGILLFFTSGAIFFLGYVETYQVVFTLTLIYMVSSILHFKGRIKTSYLISVVFGFWLSLHYLASVFVPSYLIVLFFNFKRDKLQTFLSFFIFIACFMLGYLFTGLDVNEMTRRFLEPNTSHWLPFFSGNKTELVPAFSLEHIWDVLNSQILVLPFGLFTLIGLIILFHKNINWKDYAVIFLSAMSVFSFIFIFFFNSLLGLSRDWDVVVLMSLPFLLFILYILYSCFEEVKIKKVLLIVTYVALWQTMIWIILNSNSAISIKRNISLENEKLWDKHKIALYYEEIGAFYKNQNDYVRAADYYYKGIVIEPERERLVLNLSNMLQRTGRIHDADTLLEGFLKRAGYNRNGYFSLGLVKMSENNYDDAISNFRNILQKDPNDRDILGNMASCMYMKKEYDSSIVYSNKVIELYPYDPKPYIGLGDCYLALNDTLLALKNFKTAKEMDKDGKLRNEIDKRIDRLRNN